MRAARRDLMAAVSMNDRVWTVRRRMVDDLLCELRERARAAGDAREVKLVETHISWVLLGPDVYKVKKPVKLPFLDFSTFEAREQACRTEVRINRRLAPRTYQGVVAIRKRPDGRYTFGAVGSIVDWAVRMTRLDDTRRADVLLGEGALGRDHVDALALGVAAFHADASATPRVARFGAPEIVERNVADNFVALREHLGRYVRDDAAVEIERWQLAFLRGHRDLFERRMIDGAVREGHGDLRLEHVFFHPEGTDFEVIDGIEFDERYRCADVASDVAFLAMDLARCGHVDLAERFLAMYARASNDYELYRLVDFYESYRACVRAKISALIGRDDEARRELLLAQSARRRAILDPVLIAVAGGIASGKSTLAERLGDELSAPVIDADRTRKHMLGLAPTMHAAVETSAWRGAYEPAFSDLVYEEVLRRADHVLASGRPVVIDASFRTKKARAAAEAMASKHNVPFRLLECVAPHEVCRARLVARDRKTSVSDATPDIYEAFAAGFEPICELPPTEHLRIDTTGAIEAALAQAKREIETWPRGLME
jgi:uncharacterized protein